MFEVSFGEWLKRQRKTLGLTQEQLAQQVSCSTITLRKIEAEERRPSEQIAERLAQIFNIPLGEQKAFVRFARGNISSAPAESTQTIPWRAYNVSARVNLPAAVVSLIGREHDIALVREYLSDPKIRIVTLVGPPGIGKTQLSLEVARRAVNDFSDGVFFVPLAPLDDASLVAPSIVQALGYVEAKKESPVKQLTDGIGDKCILLVLDNCEHMVNDVAPLVACLLSDCPRLVIIATSRESLYIPGEWLYPVPALEVPAENFPVDLECASRFPALTLFAERARAVRPNFALNAENIQAVASICAQLDGLPLAIELIATRIRLMSPQALLERLSDQFVLSADGMRAVSARQKTLYNAIGWSYNFLSMDEQRLFVCLSVFSGGFTLDMMEAVFSRMFVGKPVSDLVASLSDKSMLQRGLGTGGEVRFNMLVTIQQFASEVLRRTGDEAQVRDLHLAYFLTLAETGEVEIRGPHQVEWVNRIQNEQNNMRAALEWATSNQKTESALRLLFALGWPWEIRGHYREAFNWLERIRVLPDVSKYPAIYTRILNHIGRYNWTQDNFQEARTLLDESRSIATSMGADGVKNLAETLNWLGLLEISGDKAIARNLLEQGLALNRQCEDDWGITLSTFHLGILESNLEHHEDAALSLLEECLARFRQFGDLFFVSRVAVFLGYVFLDQGEYNKARQFFEQHVEMDTSLQFWDGIAEGWRDLGNLYRKQGDMEKAEEYYEQSRMVCREHGLTKTVP